MAVAFVSTSLLRLPSPCDRRELLFPAMGVRISGGWGIFPGVVSFPFCWGASIRGEDRRSNRACLSTKEASNGAVKIITVVGQGSVSPLKDSPWEEVMIHTAERLKWVDEGFQMLVFTDTSVLFDDEKFKVFMEELDNCDMLVTVGVKDPTSVEWFQKHSESVPNVICFESSPGLANKLGGIIVESRGKGIFHKLSDIAKPNKGNETIFETVSDAWGRYNSDDIRFCLLVIINHYIKTVPLLKNLRAKGLSTINCMLKNCGSDILNCLFDPNCRKALQCLNKCSPMDQVCNYRCIASYESSNLQAFSLCVLQRHNCLELDAQIPSKPAVSPLLIFRGATLNHEAAEDLFIGWLGDLKWSWRVVAGQNPAYDHFPCQYQLFYRGKARGSVWYEPVFQVRTLQEGKLVWRRRKYRIRRAEIPGTFYFSVLDNGVVSKEFWTIVDVCDHLSWGLFHYSGAAEVAGISYTGAVLVSPDGKYPYKGGEKLAAALERCRIKEWELYSVDNCSCIDPPLGIPEGSSLHKVIVVRDDRWLPLQHNDQFLLN